MKIKITKYTLLIAALSLAACSKEDDGALVQDTQQPVAGSMTFQASFEQSLSKASLSQNKTLFASGDAISVFDGKSNNKFSTTGSGASVSFTGTAIATTDGYTALFPYNEAAKINADGSISTSIPASQTGSNTGIVAVAKAAADQSTFQLKNVNSIVSFQTTEKCQSIKVAANKEIAGEISVAIGDDGVPTSTVTKGVKEVTLTDATNGGNISVLPVDDVDLVVTCIYDDGKSRTFYYYGISLKRSTALNFGNLDDLVSITLDVSEIDDASVNNVVLKKGTKYYLPTLSNYSQTLWVGSDGSLYNNGEETSSGITSDVSYAALPENKKILIFNFDENNSKFVIFKEGEEVTMLTADNVTKEGHTLSGWLLYGDETEYLYKPGEKATVTAANRWRNVNAVWVLKDVTITLDANGGTFSDGKTTQTITHKWGQSVEISDEPTYADDAKWFNGWDQEIDLKNDITLKAQWADYNNITYHDFDGKAISDKVQKYKPGQKTAIRNDITLSYPIDSWNAKADGSGATQYLPGSEYEFTGNIDLYPVKSDNKPSGIDDWTIKEF
ncbi:MAG: InlB B-repeat-containing protein [Bacteroidales bacterium]|nr:InlB B-repeat-containing protein [Bacteroidales bacterium]